MKGESKMYEKFAKLLVERGITAYQVSRATGISQTTLSDWKKGRSSPKLEKMQKIADYFGVSIDYFTEQKKPGTSEEDVELNEYLEMLKNRPECRMLFKLAKGATKNDVEQAVKIIEALRK